MRASWLLALALIASAFTGCIGQADLTGNENEDTENLDAAGFSNDHIFEGDYVTNQSYGLTLEEGPFGVGDTVKDYLASDADGRAIEYGYVLPDVPNGTQVPIIAFASPYLNPIHPQDLTELRPRLTENFVDHGYAVAFIAIRGTGDSGGCSNLMGPVERADLDQAITHLATQDWSNGNVGMLGVSYDGSTPWMVAAEGNEHLETIVPISGVNDVYQLMFHNGTTETRGPALLNALYYLYGFQTDNVQEGRSAEHSVQGIVCPEAFEGFAAAPYSGLVGERDPAGYWAERNMRPLVEANYDGSIFLVHGLQDWNVDPHHALPWVHDDLDHKADLTVKYWLGQWNHAWPDGDYLDQPIRRVDFIETLLHWFDYWLKEDETVDLGPKVQVQDSTGQWRSSTHWPAQDTNKTTFYLAQEGELTQASDTSTGTVNVAAAPGSLYAGGEPTDCIACADPTTEQQLTCGGCQIFTSSNLTEDLRFAGLPTLHVNVTPTGPTGHLSAFLYAVNETDQERLAWTQMDLRFADGDEEMEPVVPGEKLTALMQFEPLDAVAPAGSHLALIIEQGQQADHAPTTPPAPVQLHVGGAESTMTLDTFTVQEDQFFTPPGANASDASENASSASGALVSGLLSD